MAIYLIRHGETPQGAARIVQTPDAPLSERGRAQARAVADRLATAGIAGILASDLARAAETAEAVARATGAPVAREPLLQERSFGAIRGTPYSELDVDPYAPGYVPPEGESWEVFHARVDRAWERVLAAAAETPGDLAVVTHGLVCRSIASRLVVLPAACDLAACRWPNTCLTALEGPAPWRATRVACDAHLDSLETAHASGAV